ncbi:uncharacterized protein Dyak_GE22509 [Drosophila yakuba]|uniref:CBM21 domain-containing protein n=1 Tax=Drosophila yakuba TaxID=7245 RepID=B4PGI3_DROYA|nr:uncharacterized protein Dyak_GE22509 [Drosophila yakuba]
MNDPGDIPLTHTSTPDSRPPCSIISIIPTIGMSSCRGRAEAFARSLSSKLRTLGSQTTEEGEGNAEDEPIINGTSTNTWVNSHDSEQTVTDLQPLRHESDSFFDFDCELESPGSPVDECEYLRLIETASNTPHNSTAESGYACASMASSHSSSNDGPYFDASASASTSTAAAAQDQTLPASELKEYVNTLQLNGRHGLTNGVQEEQPAGQDAVQEDEAFLLHVGQRLEFAVRFQCKGQQFWDNNYGANYCFQCLPSSTHTAGGTTASPPSVATGAVSTGHGASLVGMLSPTAGDAWCSSFY